MGQTWPRPSDTLRPVYQDSKETLNGCEAAATLYGDWRLNRRQLPWRSHDHLKYMCACGDRTKLPTYATPRGLQLFRLSQLLDRDYRTRVKSGQPVSDCKPVLVPLGESTDCDGGVEVRVAHYGAAYICGTNAYTLDEMNRRFGVPNKQKAKETIEKESAEAKASALLPRSTPALQTTITTYTAPGDWHYPGWCTLQQTDTWSPETSSRKLVNTISPTPHGPPDTGYYIALGFSPKNRVWSLTPPTE
jgi:hypothetical protein